jgi:Trk K+ transport system NAD-binding subunit
MKIAIIGAGWVGCHLALKLKDSHEVVLYEEDDVFSAAIRYPLFRFRVVSR